jgi:hypothetical protein
MTATLCFIIDGLCVVKWFLIWLSLCIGWATRQRRFVGRPDGSTMLWSTPEFLDRVGGGRRIGNLGLCMPDGRGIFVRSKKLGLKDSVFRLICWKRKSACCWLMMRWFQSTARINSTYIASRGTKKPWPEHFDYPHKSLFHLNACTIPFGSFIQVYGRNHNRQGILSLYQISPYPGTVIHKMGSSLYCAHHMTLTHV